MSDTPRVPLQGNIVLSSKIPVILNTEPNRVIIIADNDDPIIVIDDDVTNSVDTTGG